MTLETDNVAYVAQLVAQNPLTHIKVAMERAPVAEPSGDAVPSEVAIPSGVACPSSRAAGPSSRAAVPSSRAAAPSSRVAVVPSVPPAAG